MSAAAHLLRRRSSFLLQQRQKIHALSIPFLGTPVQSRNPLRSSAARGRKFSATSTAKPPEISAPESNSSSSNRALKFATAGAAILLLSSGAWYITRDEYPQVQHVGLPQIFHGRFEEEKAPTQIYEKSITVVQSGDVEEEVVKEEVVGNTGETLSHDQEQAHEGQPLYEVADDIRAASIEAAEIVEGQFEKSPSPEPPSVSNEVPAVLEYDFPQQETPEEEIRPPEELGLENPLFSKDAQQEETQPAGEVELEELSAVEALVDVVKDKVSAVKEYLFDEASHVSEESEEVIDTGRDVKEEEIIFIREKLREDNPEMFFSDSSIDDIDDTQKDGVALREELALLQEGELRKEETKVAEEQSKVVGVDVLVGAIHTAEQLQAGVDGQTFQE